MSNCLSSIQYAQLPLHLAGEFPPLRSFPHFLSLPGRPSYPLLPSYWPFSSLLNQSEGALGGWGRYRHIFTVWVNILQWGGRGMRAGKQRVSRVFYQELRVGVLAHSGNSKVPSSLAWREGQAGRIPSTCLLFPSCVQPFNQSVGIYRRPDMRRKVLGKTKTKTNSMFSLIWKNLESRSQESYNKETRTNKQM